MPDSDRYRRRSDGVEVTANPAKEEFEWYRKMRHIEPPETLRTILHGYVTMNDMMVSDWKNEVFTVVPISQFDQDYEEIPEKG